MKAVISKVFPEVNGYEILNDSNATSLEEFIEFCCLVAGKMWQEEYCEAEAIEAAKAIWEKYSE